MSGATIFNPTVTSAPITNGIQLTTSMVGPPGIGFTSNAFRTITLPPRGFWRGDTPSEFVLNQPYTYNNNPTNFGGQTASSMVIDGFPVPAGVYVIQFTDFSNGDFFMSNGNSFMFRGCKYRNPIGSPGCWNCGTSNTGALWVHFCDLGGNGSAPGDFHEVPIDIQNAASFVAYRNRISFTTTGIQCEVNDYQSIENYITDLTDFGNGTSHINGMTRNGGQTCGLILRNYVIVQKFDSSGRQILQTDCISYFQDFGDFPGTGTNADGSVGYFIDNNYVAGTGACIYSGKNAGTPANSVQNMHVTNNLVSTVAYITGGFDAPSAAEPVWGSFGNVVSNNTWSDGPNAGQLAFG